MKIMNVSKRQLGKIIQEEMSRFRPRKQRHYNAMSDSGKALANRAKRMFIKAYPSAKVGINTREGWITVNGKKSVNMSAASGGPIDIDAVVDKMHETYAETQIDDDMPTATSSMDTYREGKIMKITKRQLKRIIKEEKLKLNEEERGSGLYGVYQRDPAGSGKPRAAWEEHHATIVDEIAELMAFYPDMVDHGAEREEREYWEAAVREALKRGL